MNVVSAIKLIILALTINMVESGFANADNAHGQWMLMSHHGECVEISALNRKLPDLPDITEISSLIEFLNSQGHFVDSKELPGSAGRAYEIDVSDLSLNLVVVRESLCAKYFSNE